MTEKEQMKTRIAQGAVLAAILCCCGMAAQGQAAQMQTPLPIVATIDAEQTAPPVSKYEYGMFIEHIVNTMYSSLWAEMLDDRKFYFPIKVEEPDSAAPGQENPFRIRLRKWHPIGPEAAVVMDKEKPFVGDQSPRIELDSATPHGIQPIGAGSA